MTSSSHSHPHSKDSQFFQDHEDCFTFIRPAIPGEFANSNSPYTLVFQAGHALELIARLPIDFRDPGSDEPHDLPFEPGTDENEEVAVYGLQKLLAQHGGDVDALMEHCTRALTPSR